MIQPISRENVVIPIPQGNVYQEKRIAENYASTLLCTTCEEDSMIRIYGTRTYVCELCGSVEQR
jgi:hypothetical protein